LVAEFLAHEELNVAVKCIKTTVHGFESHNYLCAHASNLAPKATDRYSLDTEDGRGEDTNECPYLGFRQRHHLSILAPDP
jgi:hypothetical protein